MNGNAFHEWFEKILLGLEPNSVVVMENASYHSVKNERISTTANNKNEIKNWLEECYNNNNKYIFIAHDNNYKTVFSYVLSVH